MITDTTNNALEFNIAYLNKTVKVEHNGTEYKTATTKNQAWTNCHGVAMLNVFGSNSSLTLSTCKFIEAI